MNVFSALRISEVTVTDQQLNEVVGGVPFLGGIFLAPEAGLGLTLLDLRYIISSFFALLTSSCQHETVHSRMKLAYNVPPEL